MLGLASSDINALFGTEIEGLSASWLIGSYFELGNQFVLERFTSKKKNSSNGYKDPEQMQSVDKRSVVNQVVLHLQRTYEMGFSSMGFVFTHISTI